MTMTTATSTITVTHENVFVTASGRVKIAPTNDRKKFWRMWIYNKATDVWQLQPEVFNRRDAETAATLADNQWEKISA